MGESFYKLASLYSLSLVRLEIPPLLEPIQFALSSGGSESSSRSTGRSRPSSGLGNDLL
jgi:hypothetical protein